MSIMTNTLRLEPNLTSRKVWKKSLTKTKLRVQFERNLVIWQITRTVLFQSTQLHSLDVLDSKIGQVLYQIPSIRHRPGCSQSRKSLKQLLILQFQISNLSTSKQTTILPYFRLEIQVQLVCPCSQICSNWNNKSFNRGDENRKDRSRSLIQLSRMGLVLSLLSNDLTWMN